MPWVPIHQSGLEFQLQPSDPSVVSMSGSVVQSVLDPEFQAFGNSSWALALVGGVTPQLRITTLAYQAFSHDDLPIETPASFNMGDDAVQANEAADPFSAFAPSPFTLGPAESILWYYQPTGSEWAVADQFQYRIEVFVDGPAPSETSYNCECEDNSGNRTLKELRDDMARRLGYGAQVNALPPGMQDLLNSFLQDAQRQLYRRYDVLRTERIYRWPLVEGVRFYDLDGNDDACPKKMDPRKVRWVGIERDGMWTPLICGIPPELYSFDSTGWPARYEIRQCIEIWPAPGNDEAYLRIKGHFELEPFTADGHRTTIDDQLVFLMALANAKAHYGKPDARNYFDQLEVMMTDLVAGSHHTRRYLPGARARAIDPTPTWEPGGWPPP